MFKNGDVLIQKFGGSSMASIERINKVAARVALKASKGHRVVVVVSAMGKTTDNLINLAAQITDLPDTRELNQMVATGEMISASLMSLALKKRGIRAKSFNAFNLYILTDYINGNYEITHIGKKNYLAKFLEPGSVAVVSGFQGITEAGDLTTLGRGGSDLTAVVLARELGQKVCEKYTDENGVYSADPRYISNAVKMWHLNYEEMELLTRYGSKILHSRSVVCAKRSGIRIHVRSSFTTEEGTVIGPDGDDSILLKSVTFLPALNGNHIISLIGSGLSNKTYFENSKDKIKNQFSKNNIDFKFIKGGNECRLSFSVKSHQKLQALELVHDFVLNC